LKKRERVNKMKTILSIDDDHQMGFLIKESLERSGVYKVINASSGKDGISLAKKHKPDLILLDVMMPKIDGFEVLKKLKADKDTITIPVIMLTGRSDDEAMTKASSLFDESYIVKPTDMTALRMEIEKVLTRSGS
jgi:DNA-binding response OmpR family regulator